MTIEKRRAAVAPAPAASSVSHGGESKRQKVVEEGLEHAPRDLAALTATRASAAAAADVVRAPCQPPPFTIADIRAAIPSHCFKRSYLISFAYLAADLVIVATLFAASLYIDTVCSKERFGAFAWLVSHLAWTAYWIAQGCVMTGLWVIAHECGHGGFSDSNLVNDTVGWVVHSALLVPYFSWKYSHKRHHKNTNNLALDEVFVPSTSEAAPGVEGHDDDNTLTHTKEALLRIIRIAVMLTLGWPLYLMFNLTGRAYPKGSNPNHFVPSSPIFGIRERPFIALSDFGLVLTLSALGYATYVFGFAAVVYTYGIPYMIVNLWLVLITFLQHTDRALPHYDGAHWDWLRGALATIDRDYGILNVVFHHIADTHVCHHLFSNMPHYHAQEATEAMKSVLGAYYSADMQTSVASALWKSYGRCDVATSSSHADEKGVYWFH